MSSHNKDELNSSGFIPPPVQPSPQMQPGMVYVHPQPGPGIMYVHPQQQQFQVPLQFQGSQQQQMVPFQSEEFEETGVMMSPGSENGVQYSSVSEVGEADVSELKDQIAKQKEQFDALAATVQALMAEKEKKVEEEEVKTVDGLPKESEIMVAKLITSSDSEVTKKKKEVQQSKKAQRKHATEQEEARRVTLALYDEEEEKEEEEEEGEKSTKAKSFASVVVTRSKSKKRASAATIKQVQGLQGKLEERQGKEPKSGSEEEEEATETKDKKIRELTKKLEQVRHSKLEQDRLSAASKQQQQPHDQYHQYVVQPYFKQQQQQHQQQQQQQQQHFRNQIPVAIEEIFRQLPSNKKAFWEIFFQGEHLEWASNTNISYAEFKKFQAKSATPRCDLGEMEFHELICFFDISKTPFDLLCKTFAKSMESGPGKRSDDSRKQIYMPLFFYPIIASTFDHACINYMIYGNCWHGEKCYKKHVCPYCGEVENEHRCLPKNYSAEVEEEGEEEEGEYFESACSRMNALISALNKVQIALEKSNCFDWVQDLLKVNYYNKFYYNN